MSTLQAPETILRFLWGVGLRSEAEFYLSLFRSESKEMFATISVDAPVVAQGLEAMAMDLRYLSALGLYPVIVTGLFDPERGERDARAIEARLTAEQVSARRLEPGEVFTRGRVDYDRVREVVLGETIPIVSLAPEDAGGAEGERFENLGGLVAGLRSRKLIFLQRRGGIAIDGRPLGVVNLEADVAKLAAAEDVSPKQRAILRQASGLLRRASRRSTIAITSPMDLLRELFTVRGAGTLVRRSATITKLTSFAALDLLRLRVLLESAFARPLGPSFFSMPVSLIFLEENYRGVAILNDTPLGTYMSKFAVDTEAQGESIGRDLWQEILAERRAIFWRSRLDNPINGWYAKESDGMVKSREWQIFWRGIEVDQIPDIIRFCEAQPRDFPKK